MDLVNAADEVEIPPGARVLVPTGLKVAIPRGYELQIRPRSGRALKDGLTVLNSPGTIDSGYRGEIGVLLYNTDPSNTVVVARGERIAQAVLARVERIEWIPTGRLPESSRGEGGFGSTGVGPAADESAGQPPADAAREEASAPGSSADSGSRAGGPFGAMGDRNRRILAVQFAVLAVQAAVCALMLLLMASVGFGRELPEGLFRIGRVKYDGGGDWYSDPSSLPNLQRELARRTWLRTAAREDVVSFKDNEVFYYPFVYLTGHGNVVFSAREVETIRKYLAAGGFLYIDDNYGLDEHIRRELGRIFPDRPLVELPHDHPIYHTVYDFADGPPKIHKHHGGPPHGYGIFLDGKLVVYYTYNTDIGDGLEDPEVHGDPPRKREAAMRMAINVVIYALTH